MMVIENQKQAGKRVAARRTAMESPKWEGLRETGLGMKGLTRPKEGRAQNIICFLYGLILL